MRARLRVPRPHLRASARQQGFALTGVMVALIIATIASIFAAGEIQRQIQDHAAAATGRYLLQVRDAVVDLQIRYEAWLSNDSTASAPPVALSWSHVGSVQLARGSVADLLALGVLPGAVPLYPSLGDTVRFVLVRQGVCPSHTCQTSAYVYTCHPISTQRSVRTHTACTEPTGERAVYSQALLGKVLLAADGYGGHDALTSRHIAGPLMADVPHDWFDFGAQPGHVVLAAGLGATPFGQFVRHGETRPVSLRNTLAVAGTLQSDAGLLLNTSVVPDAACTTPGLYAATANKLLAVCTDGAWFVSGAYTISQVLANLPHNAAVPPIDCPAGLSPWRQIALQALAQTVTGTDVTISGEVGGTLHGSGHVNAAGAVSVHGTFNGTFSNAGSSYVRVAQRVAIVHDRVMITPADMNARAAVWQGCGG